MGVDVADGFRPDAGIGERALHDAVGAVAAFGWLGDVIGVAGHSVPHNFGQDAGAAAPGELQLLQDQDSRAFTDDKAVALGVKGAAGAHGLLVARGEGARGGESAHAERRNGGLGAAADHGVRVVVLDDAEGVSDGMRRGGAGRGCRGVRSARAIFDGDVAGGEVDDGRGDEKRRDFARSALQQLGVLAFDHVEPADAGGDVGAHALGVFRSNLEAGHFHRAVRPGQGELDEPAHLFDFFFLHPVERVEAAHFAGDARVMPGGVEQRDGADAALARQQDLPHGVRADTAAAQQTHTGNDDSAIQCWSAPLRI